jgi:hypothetical protein
MSKYSTMSFNQLRATAAAKGFAGSKPPKREELVSFLEGQEKPVGAINPPKQTSAVTKPAEVSVLKHVTVEATDKRKYMTIGRDAVKARRTSIFETAKTFITASEKPLTQAQVFEVVCSQTGIEKTANSWHDLTLTLKTLSEQGFVACNKVERKRSTYCKA